MARPRQITDERLLAAAAAVISRLGPGFTLADVAREAQVAVGTVGQRFGSKHGLLVAMTRAAIDDIRGGMRAAQAPPDSPGTSPAPTPPGSAGTAPTPARSDGTDTAPTPAPSGKAGIAQTPTRPGGAGTAQVSNDAATAQTPAPCGHTDAAQTPAPSDNAGTAQTRAPSGGPGTAQSPTSSHNASTAQSPIPSHDASTLQTPTPSDGTAPEAGSEDVVMAPVRALVAAYAPLDDPVTAANNLAQLAVDLADDELRSLMAEFYAVMEAEVAALVAVAVRAGLLDGAPPSHVAARILTAVADGTAIHWSARPEGGLRERLRCDLGAVLDGWRTASPPRRTVRA